VSIAARTHPNLKSLLVRISIFALDSLEVIDLRGRGKADVLFVFGSGHSMYYDLYSLKGDRYVEVFSEYPFYC